MQPSAKWKTIIPLTNTTNGINARTGASDFSDPDFTNYPPFTVSNYPNVGGQPNNMFWWYNNGDFPLNTPIDDWSIAYTAVDNHELSLNNIGVFMSNPDTPAFYTDNTEYAPIAFYTSLGYKTIYDNIGGTPLLTDGFRFKNPPYNNSRYVWSPNAGGAIYEGNLVLFYRDANTNGYAAVISTFGIKSLFLEIRVRPINIIAGESLPLQDYSLKSYAGLSEEQRAANPISMAYCMVHRRAATNGTYSQVNNLYTDINLVIGTPLKGYSSDIYTYFNNVHETANIETMYLPLWGIPYKGRAGNFIRYCDGNYPDPNCQNTSDFFYGYDKADGTIVQSIGGGEYHYIKYLLGNDRNIEYLRRSCACYGLFFCDDLYTDELENFESSEMDSTRWTNDEMMLGIIESDGYTRGNYSHGSDNANQTQFNWTDSTDSIFDPSVTPTPTENEYDTHTVFNTISDTATLFKRYVLNDSNVRQLGLDLFDVCDDIAGDDPNEPYKNYAAKINSNFLTNNPIDCIISLQRFPMSIPKDDNTPENIKLGRVSVNAIGYETTQTNYEYSFTGKTIYPCFGDSFLDYNPYTTYELYIPFCGTVRLDPADILYRTLNVYLNVDFSTGTCTGYVMSDNLVIETVSGNIAIDIPVTGIASATVNANLNNAIVAYQNSKIKQIENIAGTIGYGIKAGAGVMKFAATGDTDNLAFGGGFRQIMDNVRGNIGGDKANYDLQHQIVSPHVIGSASSVGLWAIDLNCRLICYYPTGDVIDVIGGKPQFTSKIYNYGIQNGFATVETNTISSYQTGLVVGVNPLLYNITTANGRPATQTELDMIENAIKEGVILPPVG